MNNIIFFAAGAMVMVGVTFCGHDCRGVAQGCCGGKQSRGFQDITAFKVDTGLFLHSFILYWYL
jgi:hypothetical protein